MRLFHRAVRRARLPVSWTGGFNPRPKMAFPLALGVGIEGARELLEMVLDEPMRLESIESSLAAQLPNGVRIHGVEEIATGARARVSGLEYRVAFPPGHTVSVDAVKSLLDRERIDVSRGKDRDKRVNIRPFIRKIETHESASPSSTGQVLVLKLDFTPNGTAKPTEILELLGIVPQPGETAPSITRTHVHLASSPSHGEED